MYAIKYFNEIDYSTLYESQEECEADLFEDASCEEIATQGNTYGALTVDACIVTNETEMCLNPNSAQKDDVFDSLDGNGFTCNYETNELLYCFNGSSAYNKGSLFLSLGSGTMNIGYYDQETCVVSNNYGTCYSL